MKKTNLTKEMAIEIRDYLFRQEREIRLVARSVPENEMGKLQK